MARHHGWVWFPLPQEGHRQAVFWGKKANFQMVTSSYAHLEPTIDQQRFVMLFKCLSTWGLGDHSNLMAKRLFKVSTIDTCVVVLLVPMEH